jgi:PAS domain S-box-containing protein
MLNNELERRVAERTDELRQREEQFRMRAALLDLATEAIMVRDLSGANTFFNRGAENLYGWTREEMRGQDMHSLLQTVFPVPREEIEAELRQHKWWQGNLVQRTRAGAEIVVACRKTIDQEGNAILEVSRDITAQLQAEEALRETAKLAAMGRVAGIIAHEINNPLAAITNTLYLVRNHPSLDDTARHFADVAEQELQRVSHITRQTLSFYRESKQPIPVNLAELLDDVLELQERVLQTSRIRLRKRYASRPVVQGFPVELRQVFLNLIGNAIQAMPSGGELRIFVREATDWGPQRRGTAISILDTGVGIRPEDARRLFQPFFSTKSTKGTGLGLWISKGIVQKYDGSLTCRSYRTHGACATCFRVFLPIGSTPGSNGAEASRQEQDLSPPNHRAWQTA